MLTGGYMRIIGGVIVVVIALVLAPILIDQVVSVTSHANIADFPGAKSIANLIPLLYIVGCLGLAGFLTWTGIREIRGRKGGRRFRRRR